MTVSMIQFVFELPEVENIKDKRRIVKSFKEKIIKKFNVTAAEVDLQDSLRFTQIGAAVVSNSATYGEKVMQKILSFAEDEVPGRLHDVEIYSESY
ncbi:MAG: DUF503 domain-containing protein [Spirochaetales bacterium]|uniref:DUF503 domain-containing protein n=1 Tax=Candidatus Thalassospirochaeta sargassi TaxID=3119039 RepID=A0AAJ1ICZ9_9SPIO|nr:DUF503 domain-containing protein [Spirochaetales bacterium]